MRFHRDDSGSAAPSVRRHRCPPSAGLAALALLLGACGSAPPLVEPRSATLDSSPDQQESAPPAALLSSPLTSDEWCRRWAALEARVRSCDVETSEACGQYGEVLAYEDPCTACEGDECEYCGEESAFAEATMDEALVALQETLDALDECVAALSPTDRAAAREALDSLGVSLQLAARIGGR